MQSLGKVVLMACMKNEGPFILEWIAYYLSIGVTKFVIVTNDCDDGTDLILDRLDEMGIVRHLPNPIMIEKFSKPIQTIAIKYASLQKEIRTADWLLIVDTDEFLNLKPGDGTLADLVRKAGHFDAMSFNQVVFGNAGLETFEDVPITQQFFQRFNYDEVNPRLYPMMFGIKTLVRNRDDLFSRFTNHLPRLRKGKESEVVWLDGSGNPVHEDFLKRSSRSYPVYMKREKDAESEKTKLSRHRYDGIWKTHMMGYVNHYSLKSLESFIVQSLRGDAVNQEVRRDFGYWRSYDRNDKFDDSILPKAKRSQVILDDLMSDKLLAALHKQAVLRHQKVYKKVKGKPAIKALIDECRKAQEDFRAGGQDEAVSG